MIQLLLIRPLSGPCLLKPCRPSATQGHCPINKLQESLHVDNLILDRFSGRTAALAVLLQTCSCSTLPSLLAHLPISARFLRRFASSQELYTAGHMSVHRLRRMQARVDEARRDLEISKLRPPPLRGKPESECFHGVRVCDSFLAFCTLLGSAFSSVSRALTAIHSLAS